MENTQTMENTQLKSIIDRNKEQKIIHDGNHFLSLMNTDGITYSKEELLSSAESYIDFEEIHLLIDYLKYYNYEFKEQSVKEQKKLQTEKKPSFWQRLFNNNVHNNVHNKELEQLLAEKETEIEQLKKKLNK